MEIKLLDFNLTDFINSLDKTTRAKIFKSIKLLKTFGHSLRLPHAKKITENIFELRIVGKIEVRLFIFSKIITLS